MLQKQIKIIFFAAVFTLFGAAISTLAQSEVEAEYAPNAKNQTQMIALYNLAAGSEEDCPAPFEYKGTIVKTRYDDDLGTKIIGFTIADKSNRRTYFNIDESLYEEAKLPRVDMSWLDTLIMQGRQVGVLAYGCGATGRVLVAQNIVDLAFIKSPVSKNVSSSESVRISTTDPGVDLARVIVQKANLRAEATVSGEVVMELPRGSILVLLSKNPTGVWYNVIYLETSEEGWIHGNNIEIQFTNERRTSKPNLARAVTERSDASPYILITNDSEHTLYLKLGTQRHVIEPNGSKRVDLAPGVYQFYASSPSVIPDIGEIPVERGHFYKWRFYTVKSIKK